MVVEYENNPSGRKSDHLFREPPKEWEAVSAAVFAEVKDSQVRTRDAVMGLGYLLAICLLWAAGAFMSVTHPGLHYLGASHLAVASIAAIAWLTKRHKRIYLDAEREIERIRGGADQDVTPT
jgi:hypothetical protein